MRAAHEVTNGDVEDLMTRVRAAALDASLDERIVENFESATAAGGIDLVERMIALESWMPTYYWTLRNSAYEVQPVEPAGEWDWATAAQVQVLHGYWGAQWTDYLAPWLEERWGTGWQQHPAEHRTAWLDVLLQELGAPEQSPAQPFAWVSVAQADALAGVWGADWHDPVRQYLDSRWGVGWDDNPDDYKVAWLDDLLTEWSARASSDEPATAAPTEPAAAAEPRVDELSHDQVMVRAFAAAMEKVPGARELTDDEIDRARETFAVEFTRIHPRPAG
jgi:hypothetical protein